MRRRDFGDCVIANAVFSQTRHGRMRTTRRLAMCSLFDAETASRCHEAGVVLSNFTAIIQMRWAATQNLNHFNAYARFCVFLPFTYNLTQYFSPMTCRNHRRYCGNPCE